MGVGRSRSVPFKSAGERTVRDGPSDRRAGGLRCGAVEELALRKDAFVLEDEEERSKRFL